MNDENLPKEFDIPTEITYEPPAIIYEGKITSRAGSPIPDAPTPPDQSGTEINLFPDD